MPKISEPQFIVLDSSLKSGTEEYRKAYQKAYRDKNRERLSQYDKQRFAGRRKRAHQTQKYGVTPEQYEAKLIEQNYMCAGCGIHQDKLEYSLCVDHDHKTGQFRGLLCDLCNRALGMLWENPDILQRLIDYLHTYTR